MTRKELMISANKIAKEIAPYTNNYSIAMSFALKEVWRQAKHYNKKRFGDMAIANAAYRLTKASHRNNNIPDWFLIENCSEQERYVISVSDRHVERQTTKAIDFKFTSDYGVDYLWVPKSILA